MYVIAVTGDHIVMADLCGLQHTNGTGFLAWIEMQETADITFDIGLIAALFEAAGKQHFA